MSVISIVRSKGPGACLRTRLQLVDLLFRQDRCWLMKYSVLVDEIFREVALNQESSYEEVFKVGLSRSCYNILLEDYAYFQFGWFDNESWRLGYYPNPWLSGVPAAEDRLRHWETLEEVGALTYEDASELIADMPYAGAVPPIRFECAPASYHELVHPAAHFHIGHCGDNRWPSAVTFGPKAFALIIAKLYYPAAWSRCSRLYGSSVEECIDDTLLLVMANARAVHLFSERERRSFHFGKHILVVQEHS
jgi:hypothetical protein